jgi:transglutaminase-like putative cysteine protease
VTGADRQAARVLAWVCAAFAGGVLLNIDRMPAWAGITALALAAWRLWTARTRAWLPPAWLRALLALTVTGIVLARFHTLNGLAAGTTLLMLMAALKLLELQRARDQLVLVGVGLFLLLAACLDRQALERTPLYALQTWLCCAALAAVATPVLAAGETARLALRALLVAVPLALALFVFFPRLPGSFWAIPRGEEARSGLSDSMSPGSITKLVANYDPAFRVKFAGEPPAAPQRYWRGPVLHDFDGRTWRRRDWAEHPRQKVQYLGDPLRYQVSLEPTQQRYWFALDLPARSPSARVTLTYDYQLIASDPVSDLVSYEAVSYLHTRGSDELSVTARREDTALPGDANPRARQLALSLRAGVASDADFVQSTLAYLAKGGFVYSLEPQPLGQDTVDELLFVTREGFCGHYASAFVDLMRAAGVPARVVTGYLGGEWNVVGGYLVVRQSDAHAWAEVWLPGRGWTRVDPTAMVAPERLNRGVFDLLPQAFGAGERFMHGAPWLQRLLQRWDAANSWWSANVVKFEYSSQLGLLARLGIRTPDARYLGWAFMAALLGWLAVVSWHMGRAARAPAGDALARAYLRLCRKLARAGAARLTHQGPLDFAHSIARAHPQLQPQVQGLLERYAQLRYGVPTATRAREVAEFSRTVARLSLPRA